MRFALTVLAIFLTGCSGKSSTNAQEEGMKNPVAVISCDTGGYSNTVAYCFMEMGQQTIGGSLKIRSGGSVKSYNQADYASTLASNSAIIPLTEPFEIEAQSNSENYVLHIEIKDGARTVFQDETSKLGTIYIDSNDL